MGNKATSDLWWKNAVLYCLDVETFMDANGDGTGDFQGLTQRIDYLAGLGVTCLWLMPFYPSPNVDDGYDITDFYNVDPRLGTLGDFVEFVRTANDRGLRVITDLVVNHTSRDHPWFQSARSSPDSPYRDWYVWRDERPDHEEKVIFPDTEESNWEYDEAAGKYYLHRFYATQPDLNVGNPEVVDEIHRIMGFWLELGIAGFRVDAVPYLIEPTGIEEEMPEDPHVLLEDMRWFMTRRRGDAILVGEVNLDPDSRVQFFGDAGDEMTGLFNFILSGALFLAVGEQQAAPLVRHLEETTRPPDRCQWMNFIRNHDELNLSRLPEDERNRVFELFAPSEDMRIYDRGIRRRMPPMLDGDQGRMRLMFSLLLTLPGTPVLWYGDEIGMGDDLSMPGRMSVRTPMQWSDRRNAGFSTASADALIRPVIEDGPFGYKTVNVNDQRRDQNSLLNWVEHALRVRKECPEFGWGRGLVLDTGRSAVFALRSDWLDQTMFAVHNLSGEAQHVSLELSRDGEFQRMTDVLSDRAYDDLRVEDPTFEIGPYGYRWIRAHRTDTAISFP